MSSEFNLKKPTHLLATVFGSGLAPIASGTFGTIASIPFCLFLVMSFSPVVNLVLLGALSLIGVVICNEVSKDLGKHDHGSIVIDEFAGLWLTFLFLPEITVFWVTVAFVLFRFFDIVKPPPIGWLDRRVSGGVGIMIDDLVAGVFAGIGLLVIAAI